MLNKIDSAYKIYFKLRENEVRLEHLAIASPNFWAPKSPIVFKLINVGYEFIEDHYYFF